MQVLSKHAGLWITKNQEIMYSQVWADSRELKQDLTPCYICPGHSYQFHLSHEVWCISSWYPGENLEQRETPVRLIIIFRPASSKLVPTPTTSQRWPSSKPIKFKGKLTDKLERDDGGEVEWCSRFVKTANSVVLDYSVDIIQLGESDFILDYGELGNFRSAEQQGKTT